MTHHYDWVPARRPHMGVLRGVHTAYRPYLACVRVMRKSYAYPCQSIRFMVWSLILRWACAIGNDVTHRYTNERFLTLMQQQPIAAHPLHPRSCIKLCYKKNWNGTQAVPNPTPPYYASLPYRTTLLWDHGRCNCC